MYRHCIGIAVYAASVTIVGAIASIGITAAVAACWGVSLALYLTAGAGR